MSQNLINPTIRIKLSDFLGTEYEKDVLLKLKDIEEHNAIGPFTLYFWYDRHKTKMDMTRLKEFILYRESGDTRQKTIIRPEFFDMFRDFIWYDIIPRDESNGLQYSRFRYVYSNPATGILEGLQNFQDTILFVNRDTTPKRKQKRNDYEDSNNR
tara:strand:- start:20628 stop:21092 length:465 start_codon:yes stop_codon:yes gene_type:complete